MHNMSDLAEDETLPAFPSPSNSSMNSSSSEFEHSDNIPFGGKNEPVQNMAEFNSSFIECVICCLLFNQSTNNFRHWTESQRQDLKTNKSKVEFPECHGSQMCMPCIYKVCTFPPNNPLLRCPICRSNVSDQFLGIVKQRQRYFRPQQLRPRVNARVQRGYSVPRPPFSTLDEYEPRFLFDTGRLNASGHIIYSRCASDADLSLSTLGIRRFLRYHFYRFVYSSAVSIAIGSIGRESCEIDWAYFSIGLYANVLCCGECYCTEVICCPCISTLWLSGISSTFWCCFNNCCCGLCFEDFCYCIEYPYV